MARVIVRNPSGAVVIDDSFVNTALKAKGAVTTANDGNGVISAVVSHTAISSSRLPILALSSNQLVYLSKVQRNGTSVSWKVATQSEGSVSYYIFDDPSSTSAAGSLVLRNAATDVVTFDSDLDYLKVVGVYVTPQGNRCRYLPASPWQGLCDSPSGFVIFDSSRSRSFATESSASLSAEMAD